jgi:GPI inositol-deacylase
MFFTGAPVLFVPGNSGSHKQSRSLASVALRKGIDNEWFQHLDYFAVDLNEEYSALFGGVLEDQTEFIEHAIRAILKLYERLPHAPKKIVIIGHSIGK